MGEESQDSRGDEPLWKVILLSHVAPLLLYGGAAVGITWPAVQRLSTHVAADLGDALQNIWNIWWVNRALGQGEWFYFCDLQFHPHGTDLYFHTLSPTTTLPAALLVFLGLSPVAAYNIMVILGLALGGFIHFHLARRFELGRFASLVAGAALSFGPFHIAHSAGGHLQLTGIHWVSLYLIALISLLGKPSVKRGALAALCLTLVTFTDWYLLLNACLVSIVLFIGHAVTDKRFLLNGRRWGGLAAAGATYAILVGPLIWKMVSIQSSEELSPGHSSWFWSGDVHTLVYPNAHMYLSEHIEFFRAWTGNYAEASTYMGLVLVLFTIVAIRLRQRFSLTFLIGALFFAVLTLGPYLHWGGEIHLNVPLPYRFAERYVPVLGLMGCPTRFALGMSICLTLGAALGLDYLVSDFGWRRFVGITGGLIIVAELFPKPFPSSEIPTSEALAAIAEEPGDFAVLDTHFGNQRLHHQTIHGRPIIIGHTSRYSLQLFRGITEDPVLEQIRNPPGLLEERLERIDPNIMFDWGEDGPATEVGTDHFEVHWSGEILVPFTGWWRFYVDEDDGCRLRVDGERVIDSWWRHTRRRVPGEARLTEGWHEIEVDYFDYDGPAVMELRWGRGEQSPVPISEGAFRVSEDETGIRGVYSARVERLPEDGQDGRDGQEAALARLREIGVRYIIKPENAPTGFERALGLTPRHEGRLLIFEVPRVSHADEEAEDAAE